MTTDDTKLMTVNLLTFVLSWTHIELALKIILLSVSITYTIIKIKNEYHKNKK